MIPANADSEMTETIPVPRSLLLRLWLALGGAALFLAAAIIQGATRAGYDPWHQAVSALSLGTGGWIQAINFVVFGGIVLSTVPIWRRILAGGTAATGYPVLGAPWLQPHCGRFRSADPAALALQARRLWAGRPFMVARRDAPAGMLLRR